MNEQDERLEEQLDLEQKRKDDFWLELQAKPDGPLTPDERRDLRALLGNKVLRRGLQAAFQRVDSCKENVLGINFAADPQKGAIEASRYQGIATGIVELVDALLTESDTRENDDG